MSTTMNFLVEDSEFADPIGPLKPNISTCINLGRKPSHGFLQKLFSRQFGMPKIITEGVGHQNIHAGFDTIDDSSHTELEVMPCPYIHPLGNRLEARVESVPLASRGAAERSGRSISRKTKEGFCTARSHLSLNKAYDAPRTNTSATGVMSIQSLMLQEHIASAAAADASYLKEWDDYIKCYSEGRYSMTAPPLPPPRSSKFTYLPSTYPPNETERLATFQSSQIWSGTDIEWSNLEIEGARSLITAAIRKFTTPYAAISFFDRDSEIVQAERGYSRHLIPRHESIASHVLLTDEAMTVLDTRKDWRFSGNPLVIGNPNIRFFAGAPLLSANSQVIGVFSIFGPEPRASFTAVQRRDLLGLGELAARKLTARGSLPSSRELQTSAFLLTGSFSGSATNLHKPALSPPMSPEIDHYRDSSVALRYHKASRNDIPRPRLVIESEGQDTLVLKGVLTPPSSDNSDGASSPIMTGLENLGKNHKQLPLATLSNQPQIDKRTPRPPTFGDLTSNSGLLSLGTFSTDLGYLVPDSNPHREDSSYMHDTTESVTRFRVSSRGFFSDDAADLLPQQPNSLAEHLGDTCSLSINSEDRETLLEEVLLSGERLDANLTNENELVLRSTLEQRDQSTNSCNHEVTDSQDNFHLNSTVTSNLRSLKVNAPVDFQAEARFAAELWAKNLELDAIYALELIPKSRCMGNSWLIAPGDVEIRILVAYGLPDSINFDIPIHLDVLRGSGAITWHKKDAMPKEYSQGFMMPLLFENGALVYRSCGVVFGAFRRRPEKLRSAEVERLLLVANVLTEILSKRPSLRIPSEDEAEPLTSSSPQPYPANEATKVSEMSFDAGMATYEQRKKSKSPVKWQLGGSS